MTEIRQIVQLHLKKEDLDISPNFSWEKFFEPALFMLSMQARDKLLAGKIEPGTITLEFRANEAAQ